MTIVSFCWWFKVRRIRRMSLPGAAIEVARRLVGQQHRGARLINARAMAAVASRRRTVRGGCGSAGAHSPDAFEQLGGGLVCSLRRQQSPTVRWRSSAARARFPARSVRAAGDRTERSCRSAGCAARRAAGRAGCRSARLQNRTSPASGESSVPSKCNSVLLPEPLWPMMATNSRSTCRSTPLSTGNPTWPFLYFFFRPTAWSWGPEREAIQRGHDGGPPWSLVSVRSSRWGVACLGSFPSVGGSRNPLLPIGFILSRLHVGLSQTFAGSFRPSC